MKDLLKAAIFWSVIFLAILPTSLNINFLHNDDAFYYHLVDKFLAGDYTLDPTTAPSFYTVGFLAVIFSYIGGIDNLPVLTALVSVLSLFVLNIILIDHFKYEFWSAILLTVLFLVNPLFIFPSIGFMTDNYFLLFLLLSFYFLLKLENKNYINWNFIIGNVLIVISYFARQLGLITSTAFFVYFLLKRQYRLALLQGVLFIILAVYHFFFFPKTGEMLETQFRYSNLTYFRHLFTTTYAILIYVSAFLLPLLLIYIVRNFPRDRLKSLLFLFLAPFLYFIGNKYFNPLGWVNERFYYLKYTVGRKGFYTEGFSWDSRKYGFPFYDQFYSIWDFVSKFVLIISALCFGFNFRKKDVVNVFAIYIAIYLIFMNISVKLYDRYLIPLFPIFIFFFLKFIQKPLTKLEKFVILFFVLVLGFYTYNYAADYIKINNYAWNKANQLTESGIDRRSIGVSPPWALKYGESEVRTYRFGYLCGDNYTIEDTYEINYPLRFWQGNKFYLCKVNVY